MENLDPATLGPAELAQIRRHYAADPAIPRLAAKLGLTTEELLARLGSQTEPEFHVAPTYDREADVSLFERCVAFVRARQSHELARNTDRFTPSARR